MNGARSYSEVFNWGYVSLMVRRVELHREHMDTVEEVLRTHHFSGHI